MGSDKVTEERSKEWPVPRSASRRLIGLELEYDSLGCPLHRFTLPEGWAEKSDMSLTNGVEYVLEPPLPLVEARWAVENFSLAATKARAHLAKKGGYHIHVQVQDYEIEDAARLANLYIRYQPCIDLLCGKSRRSKPGNTYCMPFDSHVTKENLASMFQLENLTTTRTNAKASRHRLVLNFAMMRCSHRFDRTIEFRQPSPSKHLANIYGWACFATALVEYAFYFPAEANRFISKRCAWSNFIAMVSDAEVKLNYHKLVEWVQWRRDYLNKVPQGVNLHKLYHSLVGNPHGLFYISRKLGLNYAAAKRIMELEVRKGKTVECGGYGTAKRWMVKYESVAQVDLEEIIKTMEAAESPAMSVAVPVGNQ